MKGWGEFFNAVVDMREKQKAYFAYREEDSLASKFELLKKAKAAEKIIDTEIEAHIRREAERNTPTLFGGNQ
jgi:hypothetical protein